MKNTEETGNVQDKKHYQWKRKIENGKLKCASRNRDTERETSTPSTAEETSYLRISARSERENEQIEVGMRSGVFTSHCSARFGGSACFYGSCMNSKTHAD
ncbi:hypothetical protein WN943_023999 [Citrus x changshan-huyou]